MNLEMVESFISDYENRFSVETIRSYRISLKQFFAFCERNYDEVKAINIRAWLADMEEKGLKPRSIHLKLSALKSFYQYCLEENKIKKNPTLTVHTPKKEDSSLITCRNMSLHFCRNIPKKMKEKGQLSRPFMLYGLMHFLYHVIIT